MSLQSSPGNGLRTEERPQEREFLQSGRHIPSRRDVMDYAGLGRTQVLGKEAGIRYFRGSDAVQAGPNHSASSFQAKLSAKPQEFPQQLCETPIYSEGRS